MNDEEKIYSEASTTIRLAYSLSQGTIGVLVSASAALVGTGVAQGANEVVWAALVLPLVSVVLWLRALDVLAYALPVAIAIEEGMPEGKRLWTSMMYGGPFPKVLKAYHSSNAGWRRRLAVSRAALRHSPVLHLGVVWFVAQLILTILVT